MRDNITPGEPCVCLLVFVGFVCLFVSAVEIEELGVTQGFFFLIFFFSIKTSNRSAPTSVQFFFRFRLFVP